MATRGGRPVFRVCSSTLDAMICVVISASAATPAPQQLQNIQEFNKFNKSNHGTQRGHSQGYPAVELWFYPLDFWSNVMNLHAVFVSHHHVVCSPGVCPQDHTILTDKNKEYKKK